MYEDLVKELRDLLRAYKATDNGDCRQAKLLSQSADSIEELSKSRKCGRWIKPVPGDGEPYCSECKGGVMTSGGMFPYYLYTNFCPSCGADMKNASVLLRRVDNE